MCDLGHGDSSHIDPIEENDRYKQPQFLAHTLKVRDRRFVVVRSDTDCSSIGTLAKIICDTGVRADMSDSTSCDTTVVRIKIAAKQIQAGAATTLEAASSDVDKAATAKACFESRRDWEIEQYFWYVGKALVFGSWFVAAASSEAELPRVVRTNA